MRDPPKNVGQLLGLELWQEHVHGVLNGSPHPLRGLPRQLASHQHQGGPVQGTPPVPGAQQHDRRIRLLLCRRGPVQGGDVGRERLPEGAAGSVAGGAEGPELAGELVGGGGAQVGRQHAVHRRPQGAGVVLQPCEGLHCVGQGLQGGHTPRPEKGLPCSGHVMKVSKSFSTQQPCIASLNYNSRLHNLP